MAHLCSVYPFHADASFGERGVLMGANVTAGMAGFYFDPFEFYAQGHLTNPNMIVMGSVGFGKSATVKALIRRLKAVYGQGRYLAIIDPKGEYYAVLSPHQDLSMFKDTNRIPVVTLGIDGGNSIHTPQFDRAGNRFAWGNTDGTVMVCELEEIRTRLGSIGLAW